MPFACEVAEVGSGYVQLVKVSSPRMGKNMEVMAVVFGGAFEAVATVAV